MEKEIVEGNIGSVGKYDVEFKGGCLCVLVEAGLPYGSAGLQVKVGAEAVLDAIAKAIPGQIDDAVIGVIKAALLGK